MPALPSERDEEGLRATGFGMTTFWKKTAWETWKRETRGVGFVAGGFFVQDFGDDAFGAEDGDEGEERREISLRTKRAMAQRSLCASRPLRRSEVGRKSRPAPFEMTGGWAGSNENERRL